MTDDDQPTIFRTLRGFLQGSEPDEENYFRFSATLRIHGVGIPFTEVTERLGVQPTHMHRQGEPRGARSPVWKDDAWHFKPALPETDALEDHIATLWQVVRPQVEYLKTLKQQFELSVFCGYLSNCDTAGFEVSHKCLELFTALEVPFGVSVIVA
jgi:hypothetical protein